MDYFGKTIVRVASYEGSIPCGYVRHWDDQRQINFNGYMEFLNCVEQIVDRVYFDEERVCYRSFDVNNVICISTEYSKSVFDETVAEEGGATFILKIMRRQNCTWQGTLTWLEEEKEENFRSGLELLWLMNSALVCAKRQE